MIIHQAKGMHPMAESLYPLLDQKKQLIAIIRGKEYIFSPIASKHVMVQSA